MGSPITIGQRLVPGIIEKSGLSTPMIGPKPASGSSEFGDLISNMVNSVDQLQKESSHTQEAFMAGEAVELHQVMIKAEEAGVAMDLLLEVRNKLLDAYKQLIAMPM
jgi:flagellar hook-basal body complex protein FliE